MANEYLKRTPTSTGNRRVYTISCWTKKEAESVNSTIMDVFLSGALKRTALAFYQGQVNLYAENSVAATVINVNSKAEFRDNNSWYHLMWSIDTTKDVLEERVKIYVNGIEIESNYTTTTSLTKNNELGFNSIGEHNIGRIPAVSGTEQYSGYLTDIFLVDGQALTPDVFGFYKQGNGYISAGSTQATDFRPGQWVPKTPRVIKSEINRRGGFGVNGYYLPMNDSSNFGADFHTTPNSIITLKGEDLQQPRNGAPETTDAYVSQLRTDPYAANLVLAVPGIVGGASTGYGDYSADIKGSGSNKTLTAVGSAGVAVTASYYGSAMQFSNDGTNGAGNTDVINVPTSSDFVFTGDVTMECWFHPLATPSTASCIMGQWRSGGGTDRNFQVNFDTSREVTAYFNSSATNYNTGTSSALALNQWHHIAVEKYGSNMTLYVNGVAVGVNTSTPTAGNTSTVPFTIGSETDGSNGADYGVNGYIQDVRVYKGVAKYKGGFDVPKPYTPVGIATWRAVPDTTANNFATLNPLQKAVNIQDPGDFTDGNLTVTYDTSTNHGTTTSNVGIGTTGKWYVEARINSLTSSGGFSLNIGVTGMGRTTNSAAVSFNEVGVGYRADNGEKRVNATGVGGGTASAYGSSYTTGDIIGIGVSNGDLTFYKNGTSQGIAHTGITTFISNGLTDDLFFGCGDLDSAAGGAISWNFGQNPTFSGNITAGLSTFTDGNGKGLFRYEPPTDFLALCEDNLPTPAIKNPGEYFKTVLYTGDGNSGRSITGVGFKPDLVWIKNRSNAAAHIINDSVRGAGFNLFSNLTSAENGSGGVGGDLFQSFNSDGFSINPTYAGLSNNGTNASGETYAAWCWRAGAGTTSINTDGSIDSVVSVNQDAGFSIVSYTGNGTNATVGHGLNKTPKFIITKDRDASANWIVYHSSLNLGEELKLNSSAAITSFSQYTTTSPTSSVYSIQGSAAMCGLDENYIAYCWAEIEGFSKFGSYVGNNSDDGPFVYCGFKPAWVLIKRTDDTGNWCIHDSSRSGGINVMNEQLQANLSNTESGTGGLIDFLSNGFKIRATSTDLNASGGTYIFAAFAESPFTTANAK